MARQTLKTTTPIIQGSQPVVFQGTSIDPQLVDTNLLARGFANIEARQEKAAEKQQVLDTTLAKIEDSLHDDDDTRAWFSDYKNQIKTEIDRRVSNGDYGDAIRYATRAAGQVLKDTEVAGQVAANTKYKTFVDDVEKNKNYDRDTKDWAIDTHPFETDFVKDDNGNTVRVDHGDYDWRPAEQVDYTKMAKFAIDVVAKETGSYGDATGNKTDANRNPIKVTSSYEKVDYNKLKTAMQATYESFPEAIESVRQDKEVDKWKFGKILDELENTPEDNVVKRTNLSKQAADYKKRIFNDDGSEKDEYEYLAYRVNPLLQTAAYNNTKYTKTAMKSTDSDGGGSGTSTSSDNYGRDLSTTAQGVTIDLTDIGKFAGTAAIEATNAIKTNRWLDNDETNSYVLNNDYEGLADRLRKELPKYNSAEKRSIESYIAILEDQGVIASAMLASQESDEDKNKIAFLQQATTGNVDISTKYGQKYETYINKLGGKNADYVEYRFRNRYDDELDTNGNKLQDFSSLVEQACGIRNNISAANKITGWYQDADGNKVLRVMKSDLKDYNIMSKLNTALGSIEGKYSWTGSIFGTYKDKDNYNFTTTCYKNDGTFIEEYNGFESNQSNIYSLQKDVESVYNRTIDKAYSKKFPTHVITSPYATNEHARLEEDRTAKGMKDTEYNNKLKQLNDKVESLLSTINLESPDYARVYGVSETGGNLIELNPKDRKEYTNAIRQAVASKKYTINAGQAGFLRGTYIQINNDPTNANQKGNKKYGTRTIFIPGLWQQDTEKLMAQDPEARGLYNYSICQAFNAPKRLANGAVISDIDESGNAVYHTNNISQNIDANTAKLYFQLDAVCKKAIPYIIGQAPKDRQKVANTIINNLVSKYGANTKNYITSTINILLQK